jgi:hypothetical protein
MEQYIIVTLNNLDNQPKINLNYGTIRNLIINTEIIIKENIILNDLKKILEKIKEDLKKTNYNIDLIKISLNNLFNDIFKKIISENNNYQNNLSLLYYIISIDRRKNLLSFNDIKFRNIYQKMLNFVLIDTSKEIKNFNSIYDFIDYFLKNTQNDSNYIKN